MIPLPKPPKVTKKSENKAIITIEPLYPGYGITIGNSYRRVLLSSLEGAAITEVKIKGVKSEFDNIPGVIENVLMILINLKKVKIRSISEEPKMISLSVKGEKEVKASDFKTGPDIKIINLNEHIATISNKATELEIEARIERGIGYVTSEERERAREDIEVLPIDAIFTPVEKVNFEIENVRVGKKTNFEKLELEVETNGAISPDEAFSEATEILLNHFSLFSSVRQGEAEVKNKEKKEKAAGDKKKGEKKADSESESDFKKEKIEKLEEIPERIRENLIKAGIKSINGLLKKNKDGILAIDGLGAKAVEEIEKMLKKHKLGLK